MLLVFVASKSCSWVTESIKSVGSKSVSWRQVSEIYASFEEGPMIYETSSLRENLIHKQGAWEMKGQHIDVE